MFNQLLKRFSNAILFSRLPNGKLLSPEKLLMINTGSPFRDSLKSRENKSQLSAAGKGAPYLPHISFRTEILQK
jgi:hypothetical protein